MAPLITFPGQQIEVIEELFCSECVRNTAINQLQGICSKRYPLSILLKRKFIFLLAFLRPFPLIHCKLLEVGRVSALV